MVCYCGCKKDQHRSERDAGHHEGMCKNCPSCNSYRNPVYVNTHGMIKEKWWSRVEKNGGRLR